MADYGSEEVVGKREAVVEEQRRVRDAEFLHLLKTYGGRYFVWEVLTECRLFQSPPAGMEETYRFVGRQDVGRKVLEICLTLFPEAYTMMLNEAQLRLEELERVEEDDG